ncbi:hypothetical protein CP10743SC13_0129 [Chlamydia psittaci 10_743_SC13]|nr:hypothetical protein CP10743SC13_0129 [Chlamydia psittaci 10_743_SC13]
MIILRLNSLSKVGKCFTWFATCYFAYFFSHAFLLVEGCIFCIPSSPQRLI